MLFIVTVPCHYTCTVQSHAAACRLVSFWARQGVHASFRTMGA